MEKMTRRDVLIAMPAVAASTAVQCPSGMRCDTTAEQNALDRKHVLAAGFTEAEADCWQAVADAAGKYLDLPVLHKADQQEAAQAIHVLQWKLMSRPAYRKYLEAASSGKK
jgi:hypothetical protein